MDLTLRSETRPHPDAATLEVRVYKSQIGRNRLTAGEQTQRPSAYVELAPSGAPPLCIAGYAHVKCLRRSSYLTAGARSASLE